jgi:hypothetical protein
MTSEQNARQPWAQSPVSPLTQYVSTFIKATVQEIKIAVADAVASRYWRIHVGLPPQQPPAPTSDPFERQRLLRTHGGVNYYGSVDLVRIPASTPEARAKKERRETEKKEAVERRKKLAKLRAKQRRSKKPIYEESSDEGGDTDMLPSHGSASREFDALGEPIGEEYRANTVVPSSIAQLLSSSTSGGMLVDTYKAAACIRPELALAVTGRIDTTIEQSLYFDKLFLKLPPTGRESSTAYSRDDLWIIASDPMFGCVGDPNVPMALAPPVGGMPSGGWAKGQSRKGGSSDFFAPQAPPSQFVFFGRSVLPGISAAGMIEVRPLVPLLRLLSLPSFSALRQALLSAGLHPSLITELATTPRFGAARCVRACAIRCHNVSTEVSAMESLVGTFLAPTLVPVMPRLLSPFSAQSSISSPRSPSRLSISIPVTQKLGILGEIASKFNLNIDQTEILRSCARWLPCPDEPTSQTVTVAGDSPIVLCHGVFGSGKSHVLVAAVMLLCRLLEYNTRAPSDRAKSQQLSRAPTDDDFLSFVGSGASSESDDSDPENVETLMVNKISPSSGDMLKFYDDDQDDDVLLTALVRPAKKPRRMLKTKDVDLDADPVSLSASEEEDGDSETSENHGDSDSDRGVRGSISSAANVVRSSLKAAANVIGTDTLAFTKPKIPFIRSTETCPHDENAINLQMPRILIAAATNTAVDRVLTGLHDEGFDDIARVGSMRKIHPSLLPNTLPGSDRADSIEMAKRDLQAMLAASHGAPSGTSSIWTDDPPPASDRDSIKRALARLERGAAALREIGNARVFGTTIAAANFQVLDKYTFPIVLLDECSQMIEPASIIPIQRFAAECVLAVGDPKQLPPVTARPPVAIQQPAKTLDTQTLFERLSDLGCPRILLKTQYRCHPSIASLCSRLFYDGQLVSGVTREPLLPGVPAVAFFDYSNFAPEVLFVRPPVATAPQARRFGPLLRLDEKDPNMQERTELGFGGGSLSNQYEADVVVRLVKSLVEKGVKADEIGVICLYRAQVAKIRAQLASESVVPTVATVDSFQGAEKKVIIVSCSRTSLSQSTGAVGAGAAFAENARRINVTLSRAQYHLFIVGHARSLCRLQIWPDVLRSCMTDSPFDGLRSTALPDLLQLYKSE